MCTSSWKVSVFYAVQHGVWLKLIIAAITGTCVFGDAATFINKYCRILFGDIFIVPFLGSALGYLIAMCSPGWGNLVAFNWNDLPVGREFYGKFLKNVKSPPHALRLKMMSCKPYIRSEVFLIFWSNCPFSNHGKNMFHVVYSVLFQKWSKTWICFLWLFML